MKQQVRSLKRQLIDNQITPNLNYSKKEYGGMDTTDNIMSMTAKALRDQMNKFNKSNDFSNRNANLTLLEKSNTMSSDERMSSIQSKINNNRSVVES